MREFKFRAWDKTQEDMKQDDAISDSIFHWCVNDKERYEIMQYTGFKDKLGKEIYESDLVRRVADGNEPREIMKVVWGFCSWGLEYLDTRSAPSFAQGLNLEIIGNIYEHKHLLEKDGV